MRAFVTVRFGRWQDLQARYRESVGPLVVAGGRANPATIGSAFDWMVRFMTHPRPDLRLALRGARTPAVRVAVRELALMLGYREDPGTPRFEGPVSDTEIDHELLARACWSLALLTDVYRVGLVPGSPLAELGSSVTADRLLELAPLNAIDELRELRASAQSTLMPALAARRGAWALGPTFEGSRLMKADADLVAAGLLLELKTGLGSKRPDGTRRSSLEAATIMQLLGYVLLDFSDEFAIEAVGVYNARYAHLATWPLPDLLTELAGGPVDLEKERAGFRDLLAG
ncbi:hypothetical protein Ais01nite_19360 [Asanoa ishikariensis]|uniref:hypothetical protein n=1 Tax=Asanoa ishikariensis TaxID=137265 RepID=UPI000B827EAD|nr:hypothetical protein [Asanoa ishikariensis]GIF63901.1 hypothetical protein Ais01nite_19360 [Asanoa ishikariensis]